ncbi:hypothetical protein D5S17_27210 [Pseudonocardiaceae bacterium YIM PH 21723]|nr:hypothetical protein D5S17_27210 [Pseudonocardiaceae bacterium YIM PH 21723]
MTAITLDGAPSLQPRTAPFGRLLASEIRLLLRRPRTIVALAVLALVPVLIGVGIWAAGGDSGGGPPLFDMLSGNGLLLPLAALMVALPLLLPLTVSMAAADAIAGEANHGSLRGLLLAPVGRIRLVAMKAIGVAAVIAVGLSVLLVFGVLSGWIFLGGNGLITLSGTTLSFVDGMGRVLLAMVLIFTQLAAVGAVALAISASTDHPLVVMAGTLGMLIVFTVLSNISALDWLHPMLLTTGWMSMAADLLRDPLTLDGTGGPLLRAGCYVIIGLGLATVRMLNREG